MQSMILMGFIGKDPEERHTANGTKVTSFSLAVNVYANKENKTQWYQINVWNDYLNNIVKHLKKGSFIMVQGELDLPKVYTGKDGVAKVALNVKATSIKFINNKKEEQTPVSAEDAKANAIKEADGRYSSSMKEEDHYAAPSEVEEKLPF